MPKTFNEVSKNKSDEKVKLPTTKTAEECASGLESKLNLPKPSITCQIPFSGIFSLKEKVNFYTICNSLITPYYPLEVLHTCPKRN